MMFKGEILLRLSCVDRAGITRSVEVGISESLTYPQIFEAAHRNADGALPSVQELGQPLWDCAWKLRCAEDELAALCSELAS